MTDDKLSAALEGIRERVRQWAGLLPRMRVPVAEFNAAQDRLAEHTPALLAAVEAALAAHPTTFTANRLELCPACTRDTNVFTPASKCVIRQAISRTLLGEEGTDG